MLLSLAPSAAAVPIWTLVPMLGKSPVSIGHWIGLALVLAGGVFMPFAARAAYQGHQRHRQRVFVAIGYEARWAGRRIDRRAWAIRYTIESELKGLIGTAYFESITEKSSKMRPADLSTAAGVGGNGPQPPTGKTRETSATDEYLQRLIRTAVGTWRHGPSHTRHAHKSAHVSRSDSKAGAGRTTTLWHRAQ